MKKIVKMFVGAALLSCVLGTMVSAEDSDKEPVNISLQQEAEAELQEEIRGLCGDCQKTF